ncbi:MAG: replicative DNA helicase, partial [Clostridia bacterium]|nr:replicative DNA helicase [Clostridia bacterium]
MADFDIVRNVPYSLDAEKAILGNIIIDPKLFDEVSFLKPEDFYLETHQQIFDAIAEMSQSGKAIDGITLVNTLMESGRYSKGDAGKYIKLLADSAVLNTHIVSYGEIVRNKHLLRQLIEASRAIADSAYSEVGTVADILDAAESSIFDIS